MRRQMASRRRQMASRHQMASRRQMPSRSETRAQEHSAGRSQGSSSWRPSCRAARCGRRSTRCARVGWRTGGRSRRRSRRARCRLPRVSSPFGVSPVFKTPREPLSKLVPFYTLKTCALSWWRRLHGFGSPRAEWPRVQRLLSRRCVQSSWRCCAWRPSSSPAMLTRRRCSLRSSSSLAAPGRRGRGGAYECSHMVNGRESPPSLHEFAS